MTTALELFAEAAKEADPRLEMIEGMLNRAKEALALAQASDDVSIVVGEDRESGSRDSGTAVKACAARCKSRIESHLYHAIRGERDIKVPYEGSLQAAIDFQHTTGEEDRIRDNVVLLNTVDAGMILAWWQAHFADTEALELEQNRNAALQQMCGASFDDGKRKMTVYYSTWEPWQGCFISKNYSSEGRAANILMLCCHAYFGGGWRELRSQLPRFAGDIHDINLGYSGTRTREEILRLQKINGHPVFESVRIKVDGRADFTFTKEAYPAIKSVVEKHQKKVGAW